MMKGDKVALIGNPLQTSLLLKIIAGVVKPDEGSIEIGQTITPSYIPDDNTEYFEGEQSICDWLSQYTNIEDMAYIRGFLGRMLLVERKHKAGKCIIRRRTCTLYVIEKYAGSTKPVAVG